ncbi:uncharacterized protein FA14DRAFT_183204 [Meira miltonrushii]|uniref:Uncharacterized protein n=1 Tax=Meira miltonrushii TaxID=1280837 RepID=A0A316VL78_9BASI|nr:uncharacterized protein FA14DRAFT_183204 [Meira miltonrushii]PWN36831.1 hypothetical protein FA14DRAFT_183204 [Meira miltonrushii]
MRFTSQFLPLMALLMASTVLSKDGPKMSAGSIKQGSDDQPDYLFYGASSSGGGGSMEKNDATISKAMGWGQKFTILQFSKDEPGFTDPNTFSIPSISQYEARQGIPAGTNFFLGCYDDDLFNKQHALNVACSKKPGCTTAYMITILWGTLGKMDFKKDRTLLASCGIVKVDGGSSCNFPDSPACQVSLFRDLSSQRFSGLYSSGEALQAGVASSTEQVASALQAFAAKTKQRITLPSGSQTS